MGKVERGISAGAGLAVVAMLLAGWVFAQTPEELRSCGAENGVEPDTKISSCTAIIRSGAWPGKNLAAALKNRGDAYYAKHEYDLAIGDFDRAIKLDPSEASAFNNRGQAYSAKGNIERAIADYDQAIQLSYKRGYIMGGPPLHGVEPPRRPEPGEGSLRVVPWSPEDSCHPVTFTPELRKTCASWPLDRQREHPTCCCISPSICKGVQGG